MRRRAERDGLTREQQPEEPKPVKRGAKKATAKAGGSGSRAAAKAGGAKRAAAKKAAPAKKAAKKSAPRKRS